MPSQPLNGLSSRYLTTQRPVGIKGCYEALTVGETVQWLFLKQHCLSQAGALVHIYTDGTVLVTHGGVEMGQGLHTKMAQIAAGSLGLPLSAVYIAETATDKVPNASPTAASASSDIYGGAGESPSRPIMLAMLPMCNSMQRCAVDTLRACVSVP